MRLVGLLATVLLGSSLACNVAYDFGDQEDVVATQMQVTLTWWQVTHRDKANVYLATATGTACNTGYFGAQFHSDGTTTLLFSMWDAPEFSPNSDFEFQSLPGSKYCHRNALDSSGKTTGTQCAPGLGGDTVNLELGVPYVFTLGIVSQNASGAMWEVTMFDTKLEHTQSVGKIFFVDEPMGLPKTCRTLGKSQKPPTSGLAAYTFMESITQPRDYLSSASWSDMKITSPKQTHHPSKGPSSYTKLGDGGCGGRESPTDHKVSSAEECEKLCTDSASCAAYEYCSGSNCKGNCNVWPTSTDDKADEWNIGSYPSVECYKKQPIARPKRVSGNCCDHGDWKNGDKVNGTSSTCLPPLCESPEIHFYMGPYLRISDKVMAENPNCLGSDPDQSKEMKVLGRGTELKFAELRSMVPGATAGKAMSFIMIGTFAATVSALLLAVWVKSKRKQQHPDCHLLPVAHADCVSIE